MVNEVKVTPKNKNRGFQPDIDTQPFQDFLSQVQANFVPAFQAQQLGMSGGQGGFSPSAGGGLMAPPQAAPVVPNISGATRPGTDSLLGRGLAVRDASSSSGTQLASAGGRYTPSFE